MRWWVVGLALALSASASGAVETELASQVVILANRDDPDSLRVAQHYAEARSVPAENIIALSMPTTETITWREFVATIWQPLQDELVRAKWINAIPMALTDSLGRRKIDVNSHRIAALVVCRGVPLAIAHDPTLYVDTRPLTLREEFRTNAGAVDSELSLLARPDYQINAFVPNPLFQNDRASRFEHERVIEVTRLDGPSVDDALALVDRALAAEQTGLIGRAYVDEGGPHPDGDRWLEATVKLLDALGFDRDVDRSPVTIAATARFDAPSLYFGWYAGDLNGPMALPGLRFPAGAIALHIHSYSARTLRSTTAGWVGPLVARGITATMGNVFEPYLQLTHHPDLLLRALARGATLADAACYALPALSWQTVVIGDPLYRPFAVPFEKQWRNLRSLPPRLAGYAALRRIRQLDGEGHRDEATAFARAAQREAPCLAVGLELAQRLAAGGDHAGAARTLGFATQLKFFLADEWALAREIGLLLEKWEQPTSAMQLWRSLLKSPGMPADLRRAWLGEARRAAMAARDLTQADEWQRDLDALQPAVLPPEVKK